MSLLGTGFGGGPPAMSKGNEAAERYLGSPVSLQCSYARVPVILRSDFVCAYSFVVIDCHLGRRARGGGVRSGKRHFAHIEGAQHLASNLDGRPDLGPVLYGLGRNVYACLRGKRTWGEDLNPRCAALALAS